MSRFLRLDLLLILLLGVNASALAQTETFDYTGIETVGNGSFAVVPKGSLVSGTITFDYSVPTYVPYNMGTVGSSDYVVTTEAGTLNPPVTSPELLFSVTANVDGLSYTTAGINPSFAQTSSLLQGNTESDGSAFVGSYSAYSNCAGSCVQTDGAGFGIYSLTGPAYTSSGFPIYDPAVAYLDYLSFYNASGGGATLEITSLTPVAVVGAVPEPSTYAMMFAGLIMLGGAIWRRRNSLDHASSWKDRQHA